MHWELGVGRAGFDLLFCQCKFTGANAHQINIRVCAGLHCLIFHINERKTPSQQWDFPSTSFYNGLNCYFRAYFSYFQNINNSLTLLTMSSAVVVTSNFLLKLVDRVFIVKEKTK